MFSDKDHSTYFVLLAFNTNTYSLHSACSSKNILYKFALKRKKRRRERYLPASVYTSSLPLQFIKTNIVYLEGENGLQGTNIVQLLLQGCPLHIKTNKLALQGRQG